MVPLMMSLWRSWIYTVHEGLLSGLHELTLCRINFPTQSYVFCVCGLREKLPILESPIWEEIERETGVTRFLNTSSEFLCSHKELQAIYCTLGWSGKNLVNGGPFTRLCPLYPMFHNQIMAWVIWWACWDWCIVLRSPDSWEPVLVEDVLDFLDRKLPKSSLWGWVRLQLL